MILFPFIYAHKVAVKNYKKKKKIDLTYFFSPGVLGGDLLVLRDELFRSLGFSSSSTEKSRRGLISLTCKTKNNKS